jgi:predicted nucleic acid-binding protein
MIFLPDVNVWLAMAFKGHEHHVLAKKWFEQTPHRQCSFCRLTQQGFLRLASKPKALQEEAVSLVEAWRLYDALMGAITGWDSAKSQPLWKRIGASIRAGERFRPRFGTMPI